jgi:hypothetical protein
MRAPFSCFFLVALPLIAAAMEPSDPARRLGNSLVTESKGELAAALPSRGRIHVELDVLGPLNGNFSVDQVRLQLLDFLRDGEISSFELVANRRNSTFARISMLLELQDRQRHTRNRRLDLDYRKEDSVWTLVAMRERAP